MNNVKYYVPTDSFIMKEDEKIQISNMDIIYYKRKLLGFAIIKIIFGANLSPLCKIKQDTINDGTK